MSQFSGFTKTLLSSVVWLCVVFPVAAPSQVQNGQFTGVITDPSGAVVANAKVIVRNLETGYAVAIESNGAGIYLAGELIIGKYSINVEVPGFATAVSGVLTLNAGTVLRADFKLQLGKASETAEVNDAAVPVNIDNARLSQTVDSTQIANLPLNGRNVYDLVQYAPGATNVRGRSWTT